MLEAQRAAFFADLPMSPDVCRDRLRRMMRMIGENIDALCAALAADRSNRDADSARSAEVMPALAALQAAIDGVDRRGRQGGQGWLARLARNGIDAEYLPVGVIGVAAAPSLPLLGTISPLAGILAAGNRAALHFGAASPGLGRSIAELAPRYFDPLELAIVAGADFFDLPFDLRVTGDPQGDAAPALARSQKSPVIIGRRADLVRAADDAIARKRLNGGRGPLAPDHIFVPEEREGEVAAWLWRAATRSATGEAAPTDADQRRMARLLDDARARGGEVMTAAAPGAGAPIHIIRHASDDMLVMQEDIGGLILPLRNYARIDDAIAAIHRRPSPPVLYYYGRDAAECRDVLGRTLSSAVSINGADLPAVHSRAAIAPAADEAEADFRRFSRTRIVCRRTLFGFARAVAGDGRADRGSAAPALH